MLEPVRVADFAAALSADSLRDRVVLVAGATGGLGRATALAVARAGACVVLLGRNVRALEAVYDEIERAGAAAPAIYPMDLAGATARDHDDLAASLEREFGRRRGKHWAARVLDLDISLWSGGRFRSRRLTIPHDGLEERSFVLQPLAAIAPSWRVRRSLTTRHLAHRLAHRRPAS